MSEERDIVERLKTLSVMSFEGVSIRDQAASEIQRLRGEVERLHQGLRVRGMRIDSQAAVDDALAAIDEWKANADRWGGEVERLRDALAKIADGSTPPEPHGHYLAHRHAVKIARAAIATPSNREPG